MTGWFTEDCTLAELRTLRTLRAKERLPQVRPGNTRYDGRLQVPTFDEVLDLVREEGRRRHVRIGVYPETKHPTYFDSSGLSLEEPLAVAALRRHHLDRPNAPVFVQSFETANLRELDTLVRVPVVQLVDASGAPYDLVAAGETTTYRDLATPAGLREVATYAEGVGTNKDLVLPRDAAGAVGAPSPVVEDAHAAGLLVHVWTILLDAGVDGLFADYPDSAVDARDAGLVAHSSGIRIQATT